MEDSDRLSALLDDLRKTLGADRVELWLGPPTQLTLAGDSLRVSAASDAELAWLRRNLHGTLEQCCERRFPGTLTIGYDVAAADPADAPGAEKAAETNGRPQESEPAEMRPANPPRSKRPGDQSLENYAADPRNQLAIQSAITAAQRFGHFNPVVYCGPPGCGKTHLLVGIERAARAARGRLRSLLITAEEFTTHFVEALDRRGLPGFRHKVRQVEMLLVDNIQFLAGKKATLVELIQTIDALAAGRRQVVLAGDLTPDALSEISPELASRAASGLVVEMEAPGYEARLSILKSLAARLGVELLDSVAELVARQVVGSGRMLSGALNRLAAVSMASGTPLTLEAADPIVADYCRQHIPVVRLPDIQRAVCEVFGLESSSLRSGKKNRSVAEPRMLAMWLARRYTRSALSEIGDYFGGRSHSTVVSAKHKLDRLISNGGDIVMGDRPCRIEDAVRRIESRLRTG